MSEAQNEMLEKFKADLDLIQAMRKALHDNKLYVPYDEQVAFILEWLQLQAMKGGE